MVVSLIHRKIHISRQPDTKITISETLSETSSLIFGNAFYRRLHRHILILIFYYYYHHLFFFLLLLLLLMFFFCRVVCVYQSNLVDSSFFVMFSVSPSLFCIFGTVNKFLFFFFFCYYFRSMKLRRFVEEANKWKSLCVFVSMPAKIQSTLFVALTICIRKLTKD